MGIAFQLADMATESGGRHLTYHTAWLADRAAVRQPRWPNSSVPSSRCGYDQAVQVHGGYGYTKDYPSSMMRDAKICEIGEGTSEIQRIVISRHILRELAD